MTVSAPPFYVLSHWKRQRKKSFRHLGNVNQSSKLSFRQIKRTCCDIQVKQNKTKSLVQIYVVKLRILNPLFSSICWLRLVKKNWEIKKNNRIGDFLIQTPTHIKAKTKTTSVAWGKTKMNGKNQRLPSEGLLLLLLL